MAALPDAQVPDLVDLWLVRVDDLEPMLQEEIGVWRDQLQWDFRSSAELVRRFVEVHALNGFALLSGGEVLGYVYYVCEERKGLIGDLYLCQGHRSAENERRLLAAAVDHLVQARGIRRIESQLMLARLGPRRGLPSHSHVRTYSRNFMMFDAGVAHSLPPGKPGPILYDQWTERRQDDAARVIAAAYRGHIDSDINDQYRSAEGARRFLFNIVQYPGCGVFFQPAAWVAIDESNGELCGVSLTSMVSENVGHVTQICVSPWVRGKGVGYELLRRSLLSLADFGAQCVSLTVTSANENAVVLYERVGFRTLKKFPALVWEF